MSAVWDYIIVGAGSAGCVLANRLSANPLNRVLLLEAGGTDQHMLIRMPLGISELVPPGRSSRIWQYWTTPQAKLNGRRLYWPRGRVLGGSSSVNAMIYTRGHPSDYDTWARLGCTGWGWEDVLPCFLRAEDSARGAGPWHGVGGPVRTSTRSLPSPLVDAFLEAGRELGLPETDDFNGPMMEGLGRYDSTTWRGERWSAARAWLRPALRRPNLCVMTETLAERVIVEHGRAVGVVVRRGGEQQVLRAGGEVLLAGGAVNSPQLLMLSGIGPGAHLQEMGIPVVRDAPGVGANLQDHLDVALRWTCDAPVSMQRYRTGLPRLLAALGWMVGRLGVVGYIPAPAGGFLKSRRQIAVPDLQLHFLCSLFDAQSDRTFDRHGFQIQVCHLRPLSRGTIRLASPDPADHPLIDPGYLQAEADMEALLAGVILARRIGHALAFAPFGVSELWPGEAVQGREGLMAAIRASAGTIYHPVGTARMGSDDQAVVDPRLRVRGVAGLRVVDASVMPILVSGNTNAPTMMIADKGADMILEDQGRMESWPAE